MQSQQDIRIEDEDTIRHAQVDGSVRSDVGCPVGILVPDHLRIVEESRQLEIVRMHHEQALVGGDPQHAAQVLRHGANIVRRETIRAGKGLEADLVIRPHVSHQDTGSARGHPHPVPTIFKEGSDTPGTGNIQFRLQMLKQIQLTVQNENAGPFRSDPNPAEAVLAQAKHQVIVHSRHAFKAARPRDKTIQTVPRAGQNRIVGDAQQAGEAVVTDIHVCIEMAGSRGITIQSVPERRHPQLISLHEDILNIIIGTGKVILLETIRLGIKAVQRAVFRAHPDGAGRIGFDGSHDATLDGMRSAVRIVEGIRAVAVQPHVQSTIIRAGPDISFRIRVQACDVIGGNRFTIRIGAHNMVRQALAFDINPDTDLRADPVFAGTTLQQRQHLPATGLGAMEDALLPVVLRIHHPHVFSVVNKQQQPVGNALDITHAAGPLLAETIRAMLIAVQFAGIGRGTPGRTIRINRQGGNREEILHGVFDQQFRILLIAVKRLELEPGAPVLVHNDIFSRDPLMNADIESLINLGIVIPAAAHGGEPHQAVRIHAHGRGHAPHHALGILSAQRNEAVSVIDADAVVRSDPDEAIAVLHRTIHRIARQTVPGHIMIKGIATIDRVDGRGRKNQENREKQSLHGLIHSTTQKYILFRYRECSTPAILSY